MVALLQSIAVVVAGEPVVLAVLAYLAQPQVAQVAQVCQTTLAVRH